MAPLPRIVSPQLLRAIAETPRRPDYSERQIFDETGEACEPVPE
jgi:hypothetical protein